MAFEAVVFQDAHHRLYTHKYLSHKAVLIFPAFPYLEVSNLLSCVLCLARMRCKILLTVFLRSDDLKRLIISEHGKNDVADFLHDSPDSHVFLLAFAFVGIVAVDHWIYWCFRPFVHL